MKTLHPERVLCTIDDLAPQGAGVGRLEGDSRVVFVPQTAPGDQLWVRVVEDRGSYLKAEPLDWVKRSELRVEPRCAVFGRCGGCQWQHLPADLQWKTKVQGVQETLRRVGVDLASIPVDLRPADPEQLWEYRNRIQLRGTAEGLGFYEKSSRSLVPISRCEIARPELNEALPAVRAEGALHVSRSRDDKKDSGTLSQGSFKVELEVLQDGLVRKAWNAPHSFYGFRQVHEAQNRKLQAWIGEQLPQQIGVLYDLYGGGGNLSLPWAQRCEQIECVDVGARPPQGAPNHFRSHALPVVRWLKQTSPRRRVRKEVARDSESGATPAVAILDPPRMGLDQDFTAIVHGLEERNVKLALLVGCDSRAWARDVRKWQARPFWKLARVLILDFFPQTVHVESAALFEWT